SSGRSSRHGDPTYRARALAAWRSRASLSGSFSRSLCAVPSANSVRSPEPRSSRCRSRVRSTTRTRPHLHLGREAAVEEHVLTELEAARDGAKRLIHAIDSREDDAGPPGAHEQRPNRHVQSIERARLDEP